ncbi:unnamed protein product [Cylicostephanus goldi]|uniref:Uncharacterized protein n=1 Tax=Cylicostephanus goldi TaxID=71465 RepID=A0A3P6TKV1_CYLGO|nr:unnamed protein product [Cylicostephanus goldi]
MFFLGVQTREISGPELPSKWFSWLSSSEKTTAYRKPEFPATCMPL